MAFLGLWLVAVGLLVGSIAALRNPRRAAIIFLSLLPLAALCLVYPDMAVEPVSADAAHVFDLPLLLEVAGLTVLFFVPILVPLLFLDNRKRAGISFVVGLLVAALAFARFRWTELLLRDLIIVSAPLLLFGLFWLGANSFGWPALLRSWPQSTFRHFSSGVVVIVVLACASAAMAVVTAAYASSLFSGDCRAKHPFTNATYESHAVFTARAVYVGLSLSSRRQIRQYPQVTDPRVGDWAIGTVQERFWGMPAGWPRLVLMTNFVFWKGETYFIDGDRVRNIAGILPVVEGGIGCSRSRRVEDAIIGFTGGVITATVMTDASGIYELDGLPQGDYTIQLHVPAGETVGRISSDRSVRKFSLKSDDLIESSFFLEWDKGDGASEH